MYGFYPRRTALVAAAFLAFGLVGGAKAAPEKFTVPLTGNAQVPPVMTSGSGEADITYDPATRIVTWSIVYSGLSSAATMAHFHGPAPAGKNAPVAIWLSKRSTMSAPSPIAGSATLTPTQAQQFEAGDWYVNVHTKDHPAGEIRGQVEPPRS